MPFFSKVFKRDGASKIKGPVDNTPAAPTKPRWEEAWSRKEIAAEEVQELIHACSHEMKSRGKDKTLAMDIRTFTDEDLQHWTCHFSYCPFDLVQTR